MTDHEKMKELLRMKDEAPITFEPPKSALIIVDVQRWFSRSEYQLGRILEKMVSGASAGYFDRVQSRVLGNIQRLQQVFRSRGLPVIFLAVGCNSPDGRDLPEWMRDFDQVGLNLLGERITPPVNHPSCRLTTGWLHLPARRFSTRPPAARSPRPHSTKRCITWG